MERLFISFEYPSGGCLSEPEDEQATAEPIFQAIVSRLRNMGAYVLDGPAPWNSYGWAIDARFGKTTVTCMLQRSDCWLLQVFPRRSLLDRLRGQRCGTELHEFATAVANAVHLALDIRVPVIEGEAEFTVSKS